MHHHTPFKATLLASLTAMAWAPAAGRAAPLDLAQAPPATLLPYVAPNVILSLDDSGSMRWNLTTRATDPPPRPAGKNYEEPNADGRWPVDASRVSVLRNALRTVFNDTQLLPDGKIRLAWQVMNGSPAALTGSNAIRILDSGHRTRFLNFVKSFAAGGATPTHALMQRADAYMRQSLGIHSAWASIPGQQGAPYLGCRRNYHILMTDGGWNQHIMVNQIPGRERNFDGLARTLPDGKPYGVSDPQTRIYRDSDSGGFSTIADWSFRSWADPLQDAASLQGALRLPADYLNAQPSETFTNRVSGRQFTVTDKYWNPRHNPATWPHMVTFTIGFSNDALPSFNYLPSGPRQGDLRSPSSTVPYGYDGDFAEYADGTYVWRAAGGVTQEGMLPAAHQADRGHDMWHAALNGRGRFYAVNQAQDLVAAFRQIVQQINTAAEPDRSSTATSGTTITRSAVGLYTAHYDPLRAWAGWITGQSVVMTRDQMGNNAGNSTTAITGWQDKSTAQRLDDLTDTQVLTQRTVLGWSDDSNRGVPFQWNSIGAAQQARLNRQSDGTTDALGTHRLSYLRGVRSMEGTATPPSYPANRPFRQRQSRQGDIVNSAIWYTGAPSGLYPTPQYKAFAATHTNRTPMIYVGGNDGMLHGFSAVDGSEKLAYVPRGVMPELPALTEPAYDDRHRYFVDGSPLTGDVLDGSQWKTLLVGTLGAGGKGYFVLDATDPGNFREANASALVLLDRSMHATETRPADCSLLPDARSRDRCEADKDIGHVFAAPVLDDFDPQRSPQITRLNNDRWAVVLGNGYNSGNGNAVLLIQYLDQGRELLRLRAPDGAPDNGLSAPRLVDINGDGRPDVAYAGDRQGHLWKFLIASQDPSQWGVAFGGKPLFRATSDLEEATISVPPTVRANDRKQTLKNTSGQQETLAVGGMMVAFGTGRNVTVRDPDAWQSGSIYSVLDNTRYKLVEGGHVQPCLSTADTACKLRADEVPRPVAPSELIDLTQDKDTVTGAGTSTGRTFSTVSGSDLDWTRNKGWRFKLPEEGERLLKPMAFFDGSNILAIHSQIPARGSEDGIVTGTAETCEASTVNGERQFLTLLNIMDGKRPSVQIMDANGDGLYSAADQGVHRMTTSKGAQSQFLQGDRIIFQGGKNDPQDKLARMPEQPVRPSWRQLQ